MQSRSLFENNSSCILIFPGIVLSMLSPSDVSFTQSPSREKRKKMNRPLSSATSKCIIWLQSQTFPKAKQDIRPPWHFSMFQDSQHKLMVEIETLTMLNENIHEKSKPIAISDILLEDKRKSVPPSSYHFEVLPRCLFKNPILGRLSGQRTEIFFRQIHQKQGRSCWTFIPH